MTLDELNDLPFLQSEITWIDRELAALQSPPPCADSRRANEYKAAIAELHKILMNRRALTCAQLDRLRRFIEDIPDTLTQTIFRLRFERGMPWLKIEFTLQDQGYYYAPGTVRKIFQRYLERCNGNE